MCTGAGFVGRYDPTEGSSSWKPHRALRAGTEVGIGTGLGSCRVCSDAPGACVEPDEPPSESYSAYADHVQLGTDGRWNGTDQGREDLASVK